MKELILFEIIFCIKSNRRVAVKKNVARLNVFDLSARLNAATKRESRVTRARKISHPAVPRHSVGAARRGTPRAAIIIIFTSPRVIKAARYTCSVRGRPLLTARTTPLAGTVGVATPRSRGGHSREGSKRRNGEGNELEGCQWGARGWRGEEMNVEPRWNTFGADAVCRWERGGLVGTTRRGTGRGWRSIHAARSLVLLLLLLLLLAPRSAVLRVLLSNRAYRRTGFRAGPHAPISLVRYGTSFFWVGGH